MGTDTENTIVTDRGNSCTWSEVGYGMRGIERIAEDLRD